MYRPLRLFTTLGLWMIAIGMIPAVRFVYYYVLGQGEGKLQSLVFSAIFIIVGFQVLLIGLVADLISFNRKILEDLLWRVRCMEMYNLAIGHVESRANTRDGAQ